jgi:hypothetical protein
MRRSSLVDLQCRNPLLLPPFRVITVSAEGQTTQKTEGMNMRGMIKNSGCVSNATHHALLERRKGGCPWDAEVYQLKKNGERYAKPLKWENYRANTPEAEVERLTGLNPGIKLEIVRGGQNHVE